MIKEIKQEYVDFIILYFSSRNIFNMGYLNYSYFRNIIRYALDNPNPKLIRFIFNTMVSKDIMKRKKLKKSTVYLFNPYNKTFIPNYQLIF